MDLQLRLLHPSHRPLSHQQLLPAPWANPTEQKLVLESSARLRRWHRSDSKLRSRTMRCQRLTVRSCGCLAALLILAHLYARRLSAIAVVDSCTCLLRNKFDALCRALRPRRTLHQDAV
jgi:hypothetical protein